MSQLSLKCLAPSLHKKKIMENGLFFLTSQQCLHDKRHSNKPKGTIYLDCNILLYHPKRMEEGPKREE